LRWLWEPANEHRAPLTRLEVLLLGWLDGWDLRLARHINLGLLALGSLTLILAVRSVRGRSALSDVFLSLLVLTPCQYQTVLLYAYAYAMALACFCLALSAVMTGWPVRSTWHLFWYLVLLLAVTLAGGPAGNIWAVGLCGAFLRGWLERKPRSWRWSALAGTVVVLAASLWMLLSIPDVPGHALFRSDSWRATWWATGKVSLGWLGGPFLLVVYPWVWLVLIIPACYLLGRILMDLGKLARTALPGRTAVARWLDLALILAAALAVTVMIGHGRARYPDLWDSRYATLVLPIGIVTYLLLVRLQAPLILPVGMTFVMTLSVGWNWPEALTMGQKRHDNTAKMAGALKWGTTPLSVLAQQDAWEVGFECDPDKLLNALVSLREADLSVFRKDRLREPVPGMGKSRVWEAESGTLNGAVRLVTDRRATKGQAVEATATPAEPGIATYEFEVPATGSYQVCLRLWTPALGHVLGLRVDDVPARSISLPHEGRYYPYCIDLDLSAGKHRLTVTLFQDGTRLDLVELVPLAKEVQEKQDHG
jgi:hypothetical protein